MDSCLIFWVSSCVYTLLGCDLDPCLNGASCQMSGETFTCTCAPGFSGTICDEVGKFSYL